MINPEEAKQIILESTEMLESVELNLIESTNRIASENILTKLDLPIWNNSSMDGFAFILPENFDINDESINKFIISGNLFPGDEYLPIVNKGEAIKIMTGAPMPPKANCVVPIENAKIIKNDDSEFVIFTKQPKISDYIRLKGSDFKKGENIITVGQKIRPYDIAKLAANGINKIKVFPQPKISIIASGNELINPGETLSASSIYDSNSYSIASMVREAGGIPDIIGIAKDEISSIESNLRNAIDSDAIICSAGVSVGDKDFIKEVVSEQGKINFWSVNIQPGKPFLYSHIQGRGKEIPFFGLPGNPVSVMVLMIKFVIPAIRKMQGDESVYPKQIKAILAEQIVNNSKRNMFARVKIENINGELIAKPFNNHDSHIISSFSESNALANIPENCKILKAGAEVDVEIFDNSNIL